MNDAFREKDLKCREWTTRETREKKVMMAVMVPLIISHDGAFHRDTVRRWKDFAPDIQVDWVRMAQSVLRYNVVIVGKFFNKGSWILKLGEMSTLRSLKKPMVPRREWQPPKRRKILNMEPIPETWCPKSKIKQHFSAVAATSLFSYSRCN